MPLLTESLREAPVVDFNGYPYFVHAITDGVPEITADLLEETVAALRGLLPIRFDRLLTAEAMGIPLVTALTLATRKPFTIARKRAYGLPGELRVARRTGYSESALHLNGLRRGERVVIVDDVASTGGTVAALAQAVRLAEARLVKVVLAINKGLDLASLAKDLDAPVEALVTLRVVDGRVRLEDAHGTARIRTRP